MIQYLVVCFISTVLSTLLNYLSYQKTVSFFLHLLFPLICSCCCCCPGNATLFLPISYYSHFTYATLPFPFPEFGHLASIPTRFRLIVFKRKTTISEKETKMAGIFLWGRSLRCPEAMPCGLRTSASSLPGRDERSEQILITRLQLSRR